jgi:hypothetical protein
MVKVSFPLFRRAYTVATATPAVNEQSAVNGNSRQGCFAEKLLSFH